jgi:hypothetical protein
MLERSAGMTKEKTVGKETSVKGFVEEFEYDDGMYGLKITTDDDGYIVDLDKTGKRLRNHWGEEVEAMGRVTRDQEGLKHIKVQSFELIEYAREESEGFEEYGDAFKDVDYDDNIDDSEFRRYDD